MDLAEFRLLRSPRALDLDAVLDLGPEGDLPDEFGVLPAPVKETHRKTVPSASSEATGLQEAQSRFVAALIGVPEPYDNLSQIQRVLAIIGRMDGWLRTQNDRVPAPSETGVDQHLGHQTEKCRLYFSVSHFSVCLVRNGRNADQRPETELSGTAVANEAERLVKLYKVDPATLNKNLKTALGIYYAALRMLMTINPKDGQLLERAILLTRRTLVADLLARSRTELVALDEEAVYGLLNRRPVRLLGVGLVEMAPGTKIELVREAKVSNLYVVRNEWGAYIPGEIANIRNLMAGESIELMQMNLREREETSVSEQERREQTQDEDESRTQSELSSEITSNLAVTINGFFDSSFQYSTGMITASASGGFDAGFSLDHSERRASKIAREAVTRAVRRVDSMKRESRTLRELTRSEYKDKYSLTNKSETKNVHAIYRWVDRIDRYQIFRFPDRLQLEFQLPEPAEYYRWRTDKSRKAQAAGNEPPKWTVTVDKIKPDKLIELAAEYHATSLPPPPDAQITITKTMTVELSAEEMPKNQATTFWNLPSKGKVEKVEIPDQYVATQVTYSGSGFPVLGNWSAEYATGQGWNNRVGFHSAFATVAVSAKAEINWVGGYRKNAAGNLEYLSHYHDVRDIGSAEVVQMSHIAPNGNSYIVTYGRAMLVIGKDNELNLQPDPSDLIQIYPGAPVLNVGINTLGLASCIVTFKVICEPSKEALAQWQLDVYDALFSAWSQWKAEWDRAQERQQLISAQSADAGSSLRNELTIREELKRQVIAWLLNESPFVGRYGLNKPVIDDLNLDPNVTTWGETKFDAARSSAAVIQFMEQAFDWSNMTYMFYPFYWAHRGMWDNLSAIQANDANFERFLRAGSARVIVPARQGFEVAVKNWLDYQVPFVNGQLPVAGGTQAAGELPDVGEDLYVRIDQEIRDLTDPQRGGYAEDNWESRMSTTLLYLETENELPFYNKNGQLPAEKGKWFTPKPITQKP